MAIDKGCPSRDTLTACLAGQLPAEQRDDINRHLKTCAECTAETQWLADVGDALNEALGQPTPRRSTTNVSKLDYAAYSEQWQTKVPESGLPEIRTATAAISAPWTLHLEVYQITREIGRGGMGVVYEAYQHRLKRRVAIKMILFGTLADAEDRVRFLMEGELLARLNHANFIQVHEVGTVELTSGAAQPYLVMEHVEGGTLSQKLEKTPASMREAAELVHILARAMQAAHAQGIIHRDLKPANVLVAGDGTLKISDFGLAKELDARSSLTPAGMPVGTPYYMAPEQAAGRSAAIGPATDVYALGAMLYEMLAGQPPFPGDMPMEVLRKVLDDMPAAPTMLRKGLPRDLETICMKCLEKEPRRRYASSGDLASDLECWLENRPIRARPVGRIETAWKWAQRHPLPAALFAFLLLSLVGGSAVSTYFGISATQREHETRDALDKERWERYLAEIAAASNALQLNSIDAARHALETAPALHRNWEWRHLDSQLDAARLVLAGHESAVTDASLSKDGKRLASASELSLRIWEVPTGKLLVEVHPPAGKFLGAALSPDCRRAATGGQRVRMWDADTGKRLWEGPVQPKQAVLPVWSPDGRYVAGGGDDEVMHVWDARTGEELLARPCNPFRPRAEFRPDSRCIAVSQGDYDVTLWEIATGKELFVLRGHKHMVASMAFSPDGQRIATGSIYPEKQVRLWDAITGKQLATDSTFHVNEVSMLAFSPDGRRIASASMDQTVGLWDGLTGQPLATLAGHRSPVNGVVFSPDGKQLLSVSEDQTLHLWDPATARSVAVLRGHTAAVLGGQYNAEGDLVVSASRDGTVRLWDVDLLARNDVLRGHSDFIYDVAFCPGTDGKAHRDEIASAAWDGTVRFWDPTTGRQIDELKRDHRIVTGLAYSPDGRQLAIVSREEGVLLWDRPSRKCTQLPRQPPGGGHGDMRPAFSPDGTLLACGSSTGTVRLWNPDTTELVSTLNGHESWSTAVAFHPDGRQLASAGADSTVRLWNLSTGKAEILSAAGAISCVTYSPDGRFIAAAAGDRTVRQWDVATGKQTGSFQLGAVIYGVDFSPDGTRLACACSDNTIRLWDTAKGREVADLRGHGVYVHAVRFSPDGTRLVSGSGDFTVRIWDTLSVQPRSQTIKPR